MYFNVTTHKHTHITLDTTYKQHNKKVIYLMCVNLCVVHLCVVQIIENFDRYKKHFINTHSISLMSKDFFSYENKSFYFLGNFVNKCMYVVV